MTLCMQLSINDDSLNPQIYQLECESFCMDEAISAPFRLETVFISQNDYTSANVVGKTAWFNISQNNIGRVVGGVILEFRVLNKRDINSYTYSVVLGPRLTLLDKTKQSEILATQSAWDIRTLIDKVLSGAINDGATISNRGVTLDYTIHSSVTGFERKNITKYNESDLNFFQRTSEYYGIFYINQFNVTKVSDTRINVTDSILVASDNRAFSKCAPATLHFKAPTTTIGASGDTSMANAANLGAVVFSLEHAARPGFQQFNLRNYSPHKPFEMLSKSQEQQDGIGGVVEYGDNFDNTQDGDKLATYRAEEAAWQTSTFECQSTIASLGSGQVFILTENPIGAYNTEYLIISMRHEAGKRGPLGYSANYPTIPYHNSFTAIESKVPFRPRRVTPKPVMSGVYNAIVQATESTPGTPQSRSVMDQYGRYLVGFVYNEAESRNTPGHGSAPIRQAQPYAGGMTDSVVSGVQFPLVSNAEVLVGYENGDPDRPIILGAAFNQTNTDVVNDQSPTVNRIRTTGGLLLEMNDGTVSSGSPPSPRYVRFDVPQNVTDAPPGNVPSTTTTPAPTPSGHYLRFGTAANDSLAGSQLKSYSSTVSQQSQGNKNESDPFGSPASSSKTAKTKSAVSQTSSTPTGDGVLIFSQSTLDVYAQGAGLMRFGSGHTTQVDQGDSVHNVNNGQHTMTALNGVTITGGKSGSPADVLIHAYNTVTTKSEGDTYDWIYGKQTKYTEGTSVTYFYGFAFTWNKSLSLTCQFSGVMTLTMGLASTITLGSKADLIIGAKVDLVIGKPIKMATLDEYRMKTAEQKINGFVNSITAGVKSGMHTINNGIYSISSGKVGVKTAQSAMALRQRTMGADQEEMGVELTTLRSIS